MKEERKKIGKERGIIICSGDYILTDEITDAEFYKYLELVKKETHIQSVFNSVEDYTSNVKKGIKNTLSNKIYETAFYKIAEKANRIDEGYGDDLFDKLSNEDFAMFFYLVDEEMLGRRNSLYDLISLYKETTKLKNWQSNQNLLNQYLQDNQKYDIKDISEYTLKRQAHYKKEIEQGSFEPSKILNSYFGYTLKDLKEFIELTKINNTLTNILKLNTNEEQLEYIKIAQNNKYYFKNTKLKYIGFMKQDLAKNISGIIIPNKEIIELNGENFIFLIHRIKGLLQDKITQKLDNDISNWDRNYEVQSYISCSLINDLYMAFTDGDYLTMGFKNISPDDIIAMNVKDMRFLKQDLYGGHAIQSSQFMSTNDLLENSSYSYNEIVIKRYRDKKAVLPDYVISFDKIDDKTKNAAEYFKVPIYLIVLEKYAELLVQRLNELKNTDIKKYLLFLKRLAGCKYCTTGCLHDYYEYIIQSDALETDNIEANEIIKKIKHL